MTEIRAKSGIKALLHTSLLIDGRMLLPILKDIALYFLLVGLLTLVHSSVVLKPQYLPEIGAISQVDVKADRDILVEDVETTSKLRELAGHNSPAVYDWDPGMVDSVVRQIHENLDWLGNVRSSSPSAATLDSLRDSFSQRLEEDVSPAAMKALLELDDRQRLKIAVGNWLDSTRHQPVVGGPEVLKDLQENPYIVNVVTDAAEKKDLAEGSWVDLGSMRDLLGETIAEPLAAYSVEIREWILGEVRELIRPNLVLNLTETQQRKKKAASAVEAVFFQARRGQMIVREGAVVTASARLKIEAIQRNQWTGVLVLKMVGLAAILAIALWLGSWFLSVTAANFPRDRKTFYMLGTILLISSLISSVTLAVGRGVVGVFGWPAEMVAYLPHVALASAMASLMVGVRAGIPGGSMVLGSILSFLLAFVAEGGLPLFIYYFVGSLVGGAKLRTCRRRFDVLIAGVWVGMAQMIMMPVVELLAGRSPTWSWLLGGSLALISGLLMGLWGLALIPLLESIFDVTTDSRLIELASGDHPLVKELSLRSPGTYHHSVMMGNLTEAAAENIQANPLLARVMALYHDIGKMTKPLYFVENQSGENRHDNLLPSMSAKVIMAHVKDGLELAKSYKLGAPIIEAILTHHGNSLLQYFHNRAVNQAAKRGESVNDEDYRYPGPKPHSKEAGILMLADSVEAAARSLRVPSSGQIQALVKRIVAHKIADGQLDECGLTLREIARIEDAFIRVLTLGFYHHRIEYPDQVKKRKETPRREGNGTGKSVPAAVARS